MKIKSLALGLSAWIAATPFVLAGIPQAGLDSQKPVSDQRNSAEEAELRRALTAKALALVDETLKEAQSLRLPENRIRLLATAGDVLWDRDQKRARALFKLATDGLVELQRAEDAAGPVGPVFQEAGPNPEYLQQTIARQWRAQLRQEVLNIISRRDARLAVDFLKATRPSQGPDQSYPLTNPDSYSEINLASQLADTDPAEALKVAEDSLKNGLNYALPQVVSRLREKDKEAAQKLASEIFDKLRSEDLSKNTAAAGIAMTLARAMIGDGDERNKTGPSELGAFDEKMISDLMEMVVDAALKPSPPGATSSQDEEDDDDDDGGASGLIPMLRQMLPDIQRYAPTRFSALQNRLDEIYKKADPREKVAIEYQRLAAQGSIEQLIDAAVGASGDEKESLYVRAAYKAVEQGELDRARRIAGENISDPNRQKLLLMSIDQQYVSRAIEQGKLDEARPLLSRMSPEARSNALVGFASSLIAKGDKKTALQLLGEARTLFEPVPSNFAQVQALLALASAYAEVDPASSFTIFEGLIDQLNGLLSALAVLDGFEYGRHFRDGELATQSSSQVINQSFQCARALSLLSRSDFDRAKACADRFQRTELRVTARMSVAQGILSTTNTPEIRPVLARPVVQED